MAPSSVREEFRTGLDYVREVTRLLQRIRGAHPTAGLFEAADLQWWWAQMVRPTDTAPQLFWVDDQQQPVAAAVATGGTGSTQLDPILLPDASATWVDHVTTRGLEHAAALGIGEVTLEVDDGDHVLAAVLDQHGLASRGAAMVECWLAVEERPAVTPLAEGYRLMTRADLRDSPHHLARGGRNHPDVEARLQQMSLYRPDLDLAVVAPDGSVAAYALFWYDATTATGLIEPVRTEDGHQRRGLSRHVLTAGLDRLARAGAQRVKICYQPDNPASGPLYRSLGFQPDRTTVLYTGRTS